MKKVLAFLHNLLHKKLAAKELSRCTKNRTMNEMRRNDVPQKTNCLYH
jgi:hypothetical protein